MLSQYMSRSVGKLCRGMGHNIPVARKLREVAKISLFEKEGKETIKDIWSKFHAEKEHVVAKVKT